MIVKIMKVRIVYLFCMLVVLYACSSEREVVFITLNNKVEFKETQRVPLIAGQTYGWILKVKTDKSVHWKEEFTLPSKPKVWGDKLATSNVNVKEKIEQPIKSNIFGDEYFGYICNLWSVAEGDPLGTYKFKIYIEGDLVKEFYIEFYE